MVWYKLSEKAMFKMMQKSPAWVVRGGVLVTNVPYA